MMPRQVIVAVYELGVDAVVDLVQTLSSVLDEHRLLIGALTTRVKELEDRLANNSTYSSKPPSSDGVVSKPNPKSLRTNSSGRRRRKPGGQKGHPGRTLWWVENPDPKMVFHDPHECEGWGMGLEEEVVGSGYERRQLIDVPPLALEVTEHHQEARTKKCIGCGHINTAPFPMR